VRFIEIRRVISLALVFSLLMPLSLSAASWIDAIDRRVELPDLPQRIVSLVPSVTETLYAFGLEEKIVGVTSFCNYPDQAKSKPQVGDYSAPNLEAILLQQPDLVFLSADSATPARLAKMERLRLPVYVVYPKSLDETIKMFRQIGQVTGKPAAGERLAQELTEALDELQKKINGSRRPKVLFCVMAQPLTVAGPNTLVGDLIAAAGGSNVVTTGFNRYPMWNSEALLMSDPDIIIVSPHPGTPNPIELFATWAELSAVKNRRIISVNPDWVHRPGPRLPLGLDALGEAFHGKQNSPERIP